MTNAENRDTAPEEGATGANGVTKPTGAAGKATVAKAAPKDGKRPQSQRRGAKGAVRRKPSTKTAQTGATAVAQKPRPEGKGARILELIGRAKGATLAEILQATKWQAHSVRGFLSRAAKAQRVKIASTRNEAGDRVYQLER
jgi:hypothetical protein